MEGGQRREGGDEHTIERTLRYTIERTLRYTKERTLRYTIERTLKKKNREKTLK